MMKVAYVLGTSSGGIPHYTAELANAVSRYAEVAVLKPEKTTADDIFSKEVKVINAFKPVRLSFVDMYDMRRAINMLSPSNLAKIFSYRNISLINKINPDIVHFTDTPPQIQIFASKIRKYPKVVTFHGVYTKKISLITSNFKSIFFSTITSVWNMVSPFFFNIKDIDRAIVHTLIHKNILIKEGIDAKKIAVIPHGAYSFFRNYGNCELEEEENTILFFGHIVASKALDVLIDAMPLVISEIPDAKLIIAGDGVIPRRSWSIIEKYRSNFEVNNYFIPNERVGEFFSRASLIVIPNRRQEGHSGSLTVAYSFGKPVVTTNVGEFPELVEEAGCGITVPPENPKALAEAIVKLLKNPALKEEMGRKALKKAEELSWDNIAKMHMKVYGEVLNERRKRN